MKRKTRIVIFILIMVIVIGIPVGKIFYENRHVKFADETMGQVLCNAQYSSEITMENITYKDLKKIDSLDMGYSGYYTTVLDLRYCTGLKELHINTATGEGSPAYYINQGKMNKENSPEDMKKLQQELESVLPKLKKLERIILFGFEEGKWSSLDFLEGCEKLEYVCLLDGEAGDYAALKSCKSLRKIVIGHSDITDADDLI